MQSIVCLCRQILHQLLNMGQRSPPIPMLLDPVPEPEQPIQLLEMNDDCLLEILEYLTTTELATVASTCTRLRALARRIFKCNHQVAVFNHLTKPPNMQQFVSILRHFNDLVNSIVVKLEQDAPETPDQIVETNQMYTNLFNAIIKYCSATRIDDLILSHVKNLIYDDISDAESLLRKVKKLALMHCDDIFGQYVNNSTELEILIVNHIRCHSTSNAILRNQFPRLKFLLLFDYEDKSTEAGHTTITITEMNTFLSNHKELEELNLHLNQDCDYSLSLIADMKLLKSLRLFNTSSEDAFGVLASLSTLETLLLSSADVFLPQMVVKFLNECASADTLEELSIQLFETSNCRCNEIKNALKRFNQLKSLDIGYNIHIDITNLTTELQLERLTSNISEISVEPDLDDELEINNVLQANVLRCLSRIDEINWCFCGSFELWDDDDEYEYLGEVQCIEDRIWFVDNKNDDDKHPKNVIITVYRRTLEGEHDYFKEFADFYWKNIYMFLYK